MGYKALPLRAGVADRVGGVVELDRPIVQSVISVVDVSCCPTLQVGEGVAQYLDSLTSGDRLGLGRHPTASLGVRVVGQYQLDLPVPGSTLGDVEPVVLRYDVAILSPQVAPECLYRRGLAAQVGDQCVARSGHIR